MFQPQDEIEVDEDGFKQYDGKPGSYPGVGACAFACQAVRRASLALTRVRVSLRSHHRPGHGRHDEHHPRLAAEPRQV